MVQGVWMGVGHTERGQVFFVCVFCVIGFIPLDTLHLLNGLPCSKTELASGWGGSFEGFERARSSKKVIRFGREQLMALRRPTVVLPEMVDKLPSEMVTVFPQDPELGKLMDERAMLRIWQASRPPLLSPRESRALLTF